MNNDDVRHEMRAKFLSEIGAWPKLPIRPVYQPPSLNDIQKAADVEGWMEQIRSKQRDIEIIAMEQRVIPERHCTMDAIAMMTIEAIQVLRSQQGSKFWKRLSSLFGHNLERI